MLENFLKNSEIVNNACKSLPKDLKKIFEKYNDKKLNEKYGELKVVKIIDFQNFEIL